MSYKAKFKEKLGNLLFLEIEKEGFKKMVNIPEYITFESEELYLPISSEYITKNIGDRVKINNLPIYYIIEGILLTLGVDNNIKYSKDYKKLMFQIPEAEECGKSLVARKIKENNLIDAYLLLKGLFFVFEEEEYMEKILLIGVSLRDENRAFEEILLEDIDEAKEKLPKMKEPYLYKGIILKDSVDYAGCKVEINEYLRRGGEQTSEIEMLMSDIENVNAYEEAIEKLDVETEKSIGTFLGLLDVFTENPLIYYYIGVGYRKLGNNEKAIEYLLESIQIESGILEVVNELAINYACVGNFEDAITLFRKAFEATKNVEICTNIVMCYYNLGKIDEAKIHLEIAKKIDPDDQIVQKLARVLEKK